MNHCIYFFYDEKTNEPLCKGESVWYDACDVCEVTQHLAQYDDEYGNNDEEENDGN